MKVVSLGMGFITLPCSRAVSMVLSVVCIIICWASSSSRYAIKPMVYSVDDGVVSASVQRARGGSPGGRVAAALAALVSAKAAVAIVVTAMPMKLFNFTPDPIHAG